MDWVRRSLEAQRPYSVPTYINYLSDPNPASVAASYGRSFTKLRTLKRAYDPDNVFRFNRNITPA